MSTAAGNAAHLRRHTWPHEVGKLVAWAVRADLRPQPFDPRIVPPEGRSIVGPILKRVDDKNTASSNQHFGSYESGKFNGFESCMCRRAAAVRAAAGHIVRQSRAAMIQK